MIRSVEQRLVHLAHNLKMRVRFPPLQLTHHIDSALCIIPLAKDQSILRLYFPSLRKPL